MSNSELKSSPSEIFKAGSKSFSLAARFFPREQEEGATNIYHWCRYCDDAVDDGEGDKTLILEELQEETIKIWGPDETHLTPPFTSFKKAVKHHNIPSFYALELLEGMKMDVLNYQYRSFRELKLYCYRVAGTVGLMMTHAMGVFDQRALKMAASMGIGMQLTNIARDIKEDFSRHRIYIPNDWLEDEKIQKPDMMMEQNKASLFSIQTRLIMEAEKYYQEGREGLIHLPWRAALAVHIAHLFYRDIGREILSKGEISLERRTVISLPRKIILVFLALWDTFLTLPSRFGRGRRKVVIDKIWSQM